MEISGFVMTTHKKMLQIKLGQYGKKTRWYVQFLQPNHCMLPGRRPHRNKEGVIGATGHWLDKTQYFELSISLLSVIISVLICYLEKMDVLIRGLVEYSAVEKEANILQELSHFPCTSVDLFDVVPFAPFSTGSTVLFSLPAMICSHFFFVGIP